MSWSPKEPAKIRTVDPPSRASPSFGALKITGTTQCSMLTDRVPESPAAVNPNGDIARFEMRQRPTR